MSKTKIRASLRAFLALTLAVLLALPATAYATQSDVRVTDYASSQSAGTPVTSVTIGDVDEPEAGSPLDDKAVVSTKEGENWEIPVLWIDSNLQLATVADEGQSYLPALAFFLPSDYTVADADNTGAFTITLAPELVKLFGNEDIVSVYDDATGITYILPASLRNFFARAGSVSEQAAEPAAEPAAEQAAQTATEQTATDQAKRKLVDLYCSQSAKDALGYEELEYLLDLILNKLHPQAVNLLREKFPAFDKAAANGEIGTRIGFYIYYKTGDEDGLLEHETAPAQALAYVDGHAKKIDGRMTYVYMLAINAEQASQKDASGRVTIVREGEKANDLQNTLVHELFHAYMDDYNRTGMVGGTNESNLLEDPDDATEEQEVVYKSIHYPLWFIEGTATMMENVYQYRKDLFAKLYAAVPSLNYAAGSTNAIYYNYLSARDGKISVGFQLKYAAEGGMDERDLPVDPAPSRYVSGYLATVYLSSMAAESGGMGQAVTTKDGKTTVSSEVIRKGLNSILERMHNGETLDQVIIDISKDEWGTSRYASTDDFEHTFICGPLTATGYAGDPLSMTFISNFMNYMESMNADSSRAFGANGSVLFDFDRDFAGPLDNSKTATTDILKIADSNKAIESTVPNSTALKGGGKSQSGRSVQTDAATAEAATDAEKDSETASEVAASDDSDDKSVATAAATSAETSDTESAATDATATQTTSTELAAAAKTVATTTDATSDSDAVTE